MDSMELDAMPVVRERPLNSLTYMATSPSLINDKIDWFIILRI